MEIYLDNAATTRLAPEVREAMLPFLDDRFGNPSSDHVRGVEARRAVERAREEVARAAGAHPREVVFTSGGTEADALALLGAMAPALRRGRGHLVCSAVEHPAVLNTCRYLETRGASLTVVEVDGQGRVSPEAVAAAVGPDTVVVSVMHVNNEIGTVQPVAEVARRVKERNPRTLVHTDAVQSFTKLPVDVRALGVDLVSLSSHKIHGPMGVGALVVREGVHLSPLFHGGGQERGLRPGTENVPGIVGFGVAAHQGVRWMLDHPTRMAALRERLIEGVLGAVPGALLNGPREGGAPNIVHFTIKGVESEVLLHALEAEGVLASAGSACHSRERSLSHVLAALGRKPGGEGHVRLSLSRFTTEAEVEAAIQTVVRAASRLRRG